MLTLLARGEDDTPAVRVAIEQILASPKEPTGLVELKILQANITSYRTEIRKMGDRPNGASGLSAGNPYHSR